MARAAGRAIQLEPQHPPVRPAMISNDAYRSRLQATITTLQYWAPSIADVASVEESEASDHWRIEARPHLANACPFELILRVDRHYSIMVGGEIYEDRPIPSLDLFVPLLDAIVSGAVLQRRWFSTATATLRAVETVILLPGDRRWHEGNTSAAPLPDGSECRDRYFLPYQR